MTRSPTSVPIRSHRTLRFPAARALPAGVALLAGASFGASAWIAFGFYDVSAWGPLALIWLSVLLALLIATPAMPAGPSLAAVGGLLVLGVWSLLSTGWAESSYSALVDADRWLLYAGVLLALLLLLRGRELERPLLGGATVPLLVVGAVLLARMILGDGSNLFLNNRLADPLTYVNGTAAYLLMGIWPLLAVAERAGSRLLSSAALGSAVVLAGLGAMTQSRGAIAAALVTAVVLLAFAPGRVRRGWALLLLAAGVAVCVPALSDVVGTLPNGSTAPSEGSLRTASLTLVGAGAGVGIVWWVALRVLASQDSIARNPRTRLFSGGLLAGLAIAGVIAAALPVGSRVDEVKRQYRDFTELRQVDPGQVRLASGGGNRYDYWRIAWSQFKDHPVAGVGAGNYDSTYYVQRRTAENIRQPHSVELQALGETGLIGGAALLLFAGGVLTGAWRRLRASPDQGGDRALGVAGTGVFIYWLLHSSVDWIHLIPGATGIALCGAAVLLVPSMSAAKVPETPRGKWIGALIASAAVLFACVVIAIPMLVTHLVSNGNDKLAKHPSAAVGDAKDALALDGDALSAYYLESAGLARQGLYRPARDVLLEATRREPRNFVSWGLLGDLALRAGQPRVALNYYREASALNPLDAGLNAVVAPGSTLFRASARGAGG